MERRDDENDICVSPSKLDPIPLDIKMTKSPPKELVRRVESSNDEKERRASKAAWIPLDLKVDIVTRLPAETVISLQSVSRMWPSIIRSQRFVDSFYDMSLARHSSRFMITFSNVLSPKRYEKRLFIFSSSSLAANLDLSIPVTLSPKYNCTYVRGLIGCTRKGWFIVCNPSTKKFTSLKYTGPETYFGYDPVSNQFKSITVCQGFLNKNKKVHWFRTFGGGGYGNEVSSANYYPATKAICINGFVYFGAWTTWAPQVSENPVVVCFDVRNETISFIKVPIDGACWELGKSILIEYKGKLASITRHSNGTLLSFDLWILEDVKNQDWSKQTFELPSFSGLSRGTSLPGANKAGEIIFAPKYLPSPDQPFDILFYNVERNSIRSVRLQAIADKEFRDRYGILPRCRIYISPQHGESIAPLRKDY